MVDQLKAYEASRFKFYPYCNTGIKTANPNYEINPNITLQEEIDACKEKLMFKLTYSF